MKWHVIAIVALAIFCFLFGLFSVTNFDITWGKPIMGFAALIAGVLLLIDVITGANRT